MTGMGGAKRPHRSEPITNVRITVLGGVTVLVYVELYFGGVMS